MENFNQNKKQNRRQVGEKDEKKTVVVSSLQARKYSGAVKGITKPGMMIHNPAGLFHLPKAPGFINSLKPNIRLTNSRDWNAALYESLCSNQAIMVDQNLTSWNGKLISKGKQYSLYNTDEPEKILAVPVLYANLWWDEIVSTHVNRHLLTVAPNDQACARLSQAISNAMVDPMIRHIMQYQPRITIRGRFIDSFPSDYSPIIKTVSVVRPHAYGFGSDVYIKPTPKWGTEKCKNKTLRMVAKSMFTGILPKNKKAGDIIEKYGFCYRKDHFDLTKLHTLSPQSNRMQNMWKFFSAAYSWAKLIDTELFPPECYWHPNFFYNLDVDGQTPTADEYAEPLPASSGAPGFLQAPAIINEFTQTMRVTNERIADAVVAAEGVRNTISNSTQTIQEAVRVATEYREVVAGSSTSVNNLAESINNVSDTASAYLRSRNFIINSVVTPIKSIIPEDILQLIQIDLPQLALNVYATMTLKSKVAKAAFITKIMYDAGAFTLLKKGYAYVLSVIRRRNDAIEDETPEEIPTDDSLGESLWDWFCSLKNKPLQFMKQFYVMCIGLLSGFKKISYKTVSQAWTVVLRSCKNIHILSQGAAGLVKIWELVEKSITAAKVFCNNYLKCKFDVIDMKKLVKESARVCEMLTKLAIPGVCAAVCADQALRIMFLKAFDILNAVRCNVKARQNRDLQLMITNTFSALASARLKLAIAHAMGKPTLNPYSTLFVGAPGVGKSTLIQTIIKEIAPSLGLNNAVYNMNAALTWMDGYQGHESWVVIDDIFSTKLAEDVKFILNLIGPGVYVVPVAMNELRPTVFETPVVFATSNIRYVNSSDMTCPEAIDRRFPKWEVVIDPDCYDANNCIMIPEKVNEKGGVKFAYTFQEVSTIATKKLKNPKRLNYNEFCNFLIKEIRAHIVNQATVRGWTPTQENVNQSIIQQLVGVVDEGMLDRLETTPHDVETTFRCVMATLGENTPPPEVPQPAQPQVDDEQEEYESLDEDSGDEQEATMDQEVERPGIFGRAANLIMGGPTPPQIVPQPSIFMRWWTNDQGMLVRNQEAEEPDFTFGIGGNVAVWDDAVAVDVEEEKITVEHNGVIHRIPTRIVNNLKFTDDGTWIIENYRALYPFNDEDPNENTRATIHQVDASLIKFHNWWFTLSAQDRMSTYRMFRSLSSRDNLDGVITLRMAIRDLANSAVGLIPPAIIKIMKILGIAFVVAVVYALCVAIFVLTMELLLEFLLPIQPTPTSQYTPNATIKGKVRASEFQKPTDDQEPTTETSQCVANAINKITSNTFSARVLSKPHTWNTFNIVGVKYNFYAFPKHAIYNKPLTGGALEVQICSRAITNSTRDVWVTYYVKSSDICHVPKRDISIVRISDRQMVPTLTQFMPEDHLDSGLGMHVVQVSHRGGVFTEMYTMITGNTEKVRLRTEYTTIDVYDGLVTADAHQKGNSGGPSICIDTRVQNRLIGLMSSTEFNQSYSTVTPFIRKEILGAIESLTPNIPESTIEYVTSEECVEAPIIGTTMQKIHTPLKTSLKRTPLYGVIGVGQAVPVLHPGLKDPLHDGRNKTHMVAMSSLEPASLNQIVAELSTYYRMVIYDNYCRMPVARCVEDAVLGNYIGGKHIELSTSPGIGQGKWMFDRVKPGKYDFIELNDDGTLKHLSPLLVDVTKKQIGTHLSGRVCNTAFAQFPKDELRPPNKAPRSIDGSPLEDQIEYRMLFGEFDGMLNNCPKMITRSAPGIDLQKSEGHDIASLLTNPLYRAFVYDVKKWDANITLQLWNADADIVNNVYNDGFKKARSMLLRQSCLAPIVSGDYVIQPGKGMRSGYPGTANTNTRIHLLLIIYCVKQIMRRRTNTEPTLQDVFNAVFFLAYADDIVGCVLDPYWFDYIDGSTIAEEMIKIGFEVVDPDGKNTSVKPVSQAEDINFLKHRPIYSEDLNRFIWRIEMDSIRNCCNYTSGPDFTEALDSIFYHAYPHGRKFYTTLRTLVNERLLKCKIQYVTDFDMMTGIWEKKAASSIQPLIRFVPEDFYEEG